MTTEQMIEEARQNILSHASKILVEYEGFQLVVLDDIMPAITREIRDIATKAAEAELKGIAFSLRGMSKVELNIWCDATYNN